MNSGGAYTIINIIFTNKVNKEEKESTYSNRFIVSIQLATFFFSFESKSCIIVMNLSAFMKRRGGISNLKNETFTIQNKIFASKEGISQFQFCDSKLREHTKLKGEEKINHIVSKKEWQWSLAKGNLLLLLSFLKWVRS